jgi:phosphoribosylformylglycinamidine cyclo-ligase
VHVTGSGFTGNIPRILPKHLSAELFRGTWKIPDVFLEIQRRARLSEKEMHLTFNNGLGMILAVNPSDVSRTRQVLPEAVEVGQIVKGICDVRVV